MNFRRINWNNFQLGGHVPTAKVKFKLKEKSDNRDNQIEAQISNKYAKRFQAMRANDARMRELPEEQRKEILIALGFNVHPDIIDLL